ncbi:MAG: adenosylcobinamide-GDP ribazoletransferase [Cereibacter sphaeroides]|uniref:Adenosylcobinamide-GDP ribazoletransferase n=1 Tax=Cereibacter sphaeroides TaxID=1063 RepID=A0A2W5S9V4_CERSP|nr:MAG: adenosylcobinamide-GDP ribazoletransferase [Cereibacter sphaeroides]
MNSHDTPGSEWPQGFDVLAALGLLTRLPILIDAGRARQRGASAAWAWPLAGAVVGTIAALTGAVSLGLGLAPGAAAALVLAAQAIVTGALHEDGLTDTADGFWGGWDRSRRLAIMKDSHIGSYGVLALLLTVLMRWSALTTLMASGTPWAALIATACLSRAPMAVIMAILPNARGTGLAHTVGRPEGIVAGNGVIVAVALSTLLLGSAALGAAIIAALVALGVALIARARIGGQTGDVLGATQQLCETAILTVLAARA